MSRMKSRKSSNRAPPSAKPAPPAVASEPTTITYTCDGSETYGDLAARGSGSAGDYTIILQMNPQVKPESLAAGTQLVLPRGWAAGLGVRDVASETTVIDAISEVSPVEDEAPSERSDNGWGDAWAHTADAMQDLAVQAKAWWQGPQESPVAAESSSNAAPTTVDAEVAPAVAPAVAREDQGYLRRDSDGALANTVQGSTLEIASSKLSAQGEDTHYKRPKQAADLKGGLIDGEQDAKTFWCSGFNLWTLGAAGYDMRAPLMGAGGMPHAYVDARGYTPIQLYMLVDGQLEAVQAMGQILELHGGKAIDEIPGLCVDIGTNRIRDLSDAAPKPGKQVQGGEVVRAGQAKEWEGVQGHQDSDFYDAQGTAGDSLAVMGAAGMFALAGIGERVQLDQLRPGDFLQSREKQGSIYFGKGHAWQAETVLVEASGWIGGEGGVSLEDGTHPEQATWMDGVTVRLSDEVDPCRFGEQVKVLGHTRLEANEAGNAGLTGDGGVGVTAEDVQTHGGIGASGRREYAGRLNESRWSKANWRPASKDVAPG